MKRFCTKCGALLDSSSDRCPNCGYKEEKMNPFCPLSESTFSEENTRPGQHKGSQTPTDPFYPLAEKQSISSEQSPNTPLSQKNGPHKSKKNRPTDTFYSNQGKTPLSAPARHRGDPGFTGPIPVTPGKKTGAFHGYQKILCSAACLLIVFLAALLTVHINGHDPVYMLSHGRDPHQTKYTDGDFLYQPDMQHIQLGEKDKTVSYDNLLVIWGTDRLSRRDARRLAEKVDGKLAGQVCGAVSIYQILLEPASLDILQDKAELLMQDPEVIYAETDFPGADLMVLEPLEPWSDDPQKPDKDLANELNPAGNDWWAEAIHAYSAWKLSPRSQPITIGVMDDGIDLKHRDLPSDICGIDSQNRPAPREHGTRMTGLIAASKNGHGIRGIVPNAKILYADFRNQDKKTENSLSVIRKYICMIDQGAKVINNSWGCAFWTEKEFSDQKKKDPDGFPGLFDNYQQYIQYMSQFTLRSSTRCIMLLAALSENERNDVLFVQASGNGMVEGGRNVGKIDARFTGYFAGVDQVAYDYIPKAITDRYESRGITYTSIRSHILVAAGIKYKKSAQSAYPLLDTMGVGPTVDICAPGHNIFSCGLTRKNDREKQKNNGWVYSARSGTSPAAAIVSGCAAYVWSLNPDLTAPEVREILIRHVLDWGRNTDGSQIYPVVDLDLAARAALQMKREPASEISVENTGAAVSPQDPQNDPKDNTDEENHTEKETTAPAAGKYRTVADLNKVFRTVKMTYSNLSEFSAGAAYGNSEEDTVYFLFDANGKVVYSGEREILSPSYQGMCLVKTGTRQDPKLDQISRGLKVDTYGLMDTGGNLIKLSFLEDGEEIMSYTKDDTGPAIWTWKLREQNGKMIPLVRARGVNGRIKAEINCGSNLIRYMGGPYSIQYKGDSLYHVVFDLENKYEMPQKEPWLYSCIDIESGERTDNIINVLAKQRQGMIYYEGFLNGKIYLPGYYDQYLKKVIDLSLEVEPDQCQLWTAFANDYAVLYTNQNRWGVLRKDGKWMVKDMDGMVSQVLPMGSGIIISVTDQSGDGFNAMHPSFLNEKGEKLDPMWEDWTFQPYSELVWEYYGGTLYVNLEKGVDDDYMCRIARVNEDGTFEIME